MVLIVTNVTKLQRLREVSTLTNVNDILVNVDLILFVLFLLSRKFRQQGCNFDI